MNRYLLAVASLATLLLVSSARANAQEFHAKLAGFNEVPAAILSEAQGTLKLDLDPAAKTLTYTLTYSAGFSSPMFLCTNMGGPAGTLACPPAPGTVSGTIHSADVIGPSGQGISPGDFDGLEDALTSNTAYVNIHTTTHPPGEIRGEIHRAD
jgi:hypothetical protein